MEGCPAENTLLYLILSALMTPYLFGLFAVGRELYQTLKVMKKESSRQGAMQSDDYVGLQLELFGESALKNFKHLSESENEVSSKLT